MILQCISAHAKQLFKIPGAELPQQSGHLQLVFGHDAKGSFDGHGVRAADVEAHVVDDVVSQSTVKSYVRFVLIVEQLIGGDS